MGVKMSGNTNHNEKKLKVFKKIVEESPLPSVGIVEEDPTSDLKWRCLSLRAGHSITGPYRSLSLKPNRDSEGIVTKKIPARKMAEAFLRFDENRTELIFDEIDDENNVMDPLRKKLEYQINQIKDDGALKFINIEFSVEDDRLEKDGEWITKIVEMMSEKGSDLLFFIPPKIVENPEDIIDYQISAFNANLQLSKPMHVAGYVPTISPKASKKLIDIYLESGINTIFYDFRNRRLNDSSLIHLVTIASQIKSPPYVHGLHVTPGRKTKPYDSIFDLSLPSFGIQSVSNIRRHPGGPPADKNKPKPDYRLFKPIKCIHGYYIPRYGDIHSEKFECPYCKLDDVKAAYNSGVKVKLTRATIKFNSEASFDEMKNLTTEIKDQSLKKYLNKKPGLKPFEYDKKMDSFEKAIARERKKLLQKGPSLEDWL